MTRMKPFGDLVVEENRLIDVLDTWNTRAEAYVFTATEYSFVSTRQA